jgi:hypothetical protein
MPDITMCKNEQCAEKEKCYRYKATPNEYWQSYSDFKEICNMATAVIKANRLFFSKATRLGLCIYILANCTITHFNTKRKSTAQSA